MCMFVCLHMCLSLPEEAWTFRYPLDTLELYGPFGYLGPLGSFGYLGPLGTFWIPWTLRYLGPLGSFGIAWTLRYILDTFDP